MKHKKMISVFMIAVCAIFAFADFAISFGPAYTNYFVSTKSDITLEAGKANIQTAINNARDEKSNAAGFAVDIRAGIVYLMTQVAFPTKTHGDLVKNIGNAGEFLGKNAFILDTQLGAGVPLFPKTRFNLFIGGGLGVNGVSSTQVLKIDSEPVSYQKLDLMFGLGFNVLANIYITEMVGVYAGIADTFYFAPLNVQKTFTIAGKDYTISHTNKKITDILANSVNLKLGVSFKF